jgi:hypothetical protein
MDAHQQPGQTDPRVRPAIVYLIVGLPGAGKTTRARELEISASALRLTPDEWQIMLFGDQNPPDKRDLVEGKLVQLGMRAAELGTNVVRRCAGSPAPSGRGARSSTCRLTTRNNAGGSRTGSRVHLTRRST